jgi:hypothetical protein
MVVASKIRWRFYALLYSMLFLAGCNRYDHKDYTDVIGMSGQNQPEIKKILEFYDQQSDDEKCQMAEFIIETLPHQYTLTYTLIHPDGTTTALLNPVSVDSMEHMRHRPGYSLQIDTLHTIDFIPADFLINQINNADSLRKKYPWCKDVPMDQFCQYILPYQVGNEPLYDYKSFYARRYHPYLQDVLMAGLYPNAVLGNYLTPFFEWRNYKAADHIDFTSSLVFDALRDGSNTYTDIDDLKVLHTHALRALGVPCAYEYAPVIQPFIRGESFVQPFDVGVHSDFDTIAHNIYKYRVAKFYRKMFDARACKNPFRELMDLGLDVRDIPFTLNIPGFMDITHERAFVSDITLVVPDSLLSEKALYLAAGVAGQWKIVAWATPDERAHTVTFTNMGANMMYHLATYKNGNTKLISRPITTDPAGKQTGL